MAAFKSLKFKKRDDALYARIKVERADMEPLVTLAKSMVPPRPPAAKASPRPAAAAKDAPETSDGGDAAVGLGILGASDHDAVPSSQGEVVWEPPRGFVPRPAGESLPAATPSLA